jgi:hypothetical protein
MCLRNEWVWVWIQNSLRKWMHFLLAFEITQIISLRVWCTCIALCTFFNNFIQKLGAYKNIVFKITYLSLMLIIHNNCLYWWTFRHKITDILSLTDKFRVLKYIVYISTFSKFEISDEHHQRAHCEQYNTNYIGLLNSDFMPLPVYI